MDTSLELRGIDQAVECAGGQAALARMISTERRLFRQGHVWDWVNKTPLGPPPDACPLIEAATGISCDLLRPDLRWERDVDGRVVAYAVPLTPVETGKALALSGN
uniref:YdaS family helix-turn-helix protein n=1 Tax=Xanthomonas sp. 0924 TaxID=2835534 RepID=UPI003F7EEC5E